jgi:hypothetical protein
LDDNFPIHEKVHYVYICKKKVDADTVSNDKFGKVIDPLLLGN